MGMGEIGIVEIEAKRQAFQDRSGQAGGIQAPLLARIATEEGLVEFGPDHAESLLLEIGRFGDFPGFRGDKGGRFLRPHGLAEELVDGQEVDRQRIDQSPGDGLHAVPIRAHDSELLDIGPDPLVARVEDVRTVDMRHHAGLGIALRMAIARHMRALVDHQDFVPGLSKSATDDRAAEIQRRRCNISFRRCPIVVLRRATPL